jgi:glycosyltransferase involved in cell wall biosynthesis
VDAPIVIVTAYNEAPRIAATVDALRAAFPGARIVVADDRSTDGTADVVRGLGADVELVQGPRNLGKGGIATLAAERVLPALAGDDPPPVLLCDGDLAESAAELPKLVDAVRDGTADLAVAVFARKVGGGFGLAVGYAHKTILRLTGLDLQAPISGQRALRGAVLAHVVPFAPRFGMEIGMTVDAHRAGFTIAEVPLDLTHRATGRTWRGFVHRGRQLRDFVAVAYDRRRRG